MPAVNLSGELHAALHRCFPERLPEWLTATAPRCGTGSTTTIDRQKELPTFSGGRAVAVVAFSR